ncbi:T9SS type A sorting domain-containing protein [candidate division KSB1 bacterium]|nr:T9SS type A sorting domain-containing protein [candidate division KSB1 bacterium]
MIIYDGNENFLFTIVNYDDSTKKYSQSLHYFNNEGQEIWHIRSTTVLLDAILILSDEHVFLTGFVVGYDISTHAYIYQLCSQVLDWQGNFISPECGYVIEDSLSINYYEAFLGGNRDIIIIYNKKLPGDKINVLAQRLTFNGIKLWGQDGNLVFPYEYSQQLNYAVYNSQDGVIAVCLDSRFNPENDRWGRYIFSAQRISLDGQRMWPDSGIVITTNKTELKPYAVPDLSGGAVICWEEIGADSRNGIFAQQISRNGNLGEVLKLSNISNSNIKDVQDYCLYHPYPNPFNENVKIKFNIPQTELVQIQVFDINGKEVKTLLNQKLLKGEHHTVWNGTNTQGNYVSSGIFFISMRIEQFMTVQKAVLIK